MSNPELVEVSIADGVVENLNHESHKRGKNWVAVVRPDRSAPGGLAREFLPRARGKFVQIDGVIPGDVLEFAGDYYSGSGKKSSSRVYKRVVRILGTSMWLTAEDAGSFGDVPEVSEAAPVEDSAALTDAKAACLPLTEAEKQALASWLGIQILSE